MKFYQKFTRLRNEKVDGDEGSGVAVDDIQPDDLQGLDGSPDDITVEDDTPDDLKEFIEKPAKATDPKAGAPAPVVAAAPQHLRIAPEDLKVLAARGQPQPATDPKEVAKLLNQVQVTPELLQSLGFAEPSADQVKGFQQFTDALVKNAVSVAQLQIRALEDTYRQQLEPIMTHFQKQQQEQTQQAFFSKFPSLKPYEKIVKAAAASVQADPSDDEQAIFRKVAKATVDTLRSMNIQVGKAQANPGSVVSAAGGVPPPNSFSPTGRSGSASPTGKNNNPDADIYAR